MQGFPVAALSVAALALSLGACVAPNANGPGPSLAAIQQSPEPGPAPGAKWSMPWQLDLASQASEAQGEATYTALVANYGLVKGTKPALTYVNYPLSSITAKPGRNRTVDACRDVVTGEAAQKGATKVEAVAYGPDRRVREGYEGPVAFRIFYAKGQGYEVRQSLLNCKVDRRGKILDASVPAQGDSRLASLGRGAYGKGSYASFR